MQKFYIRPRLVRPCIVRKAHRARIIPCYRPMSSSCVTSYCESDQANKVSATENYLILNLPQMYIRNFRLQKAI